MSIKPDRLQLADLLEHISDGIVAFDRDFNYVYVNAIAGELLGRQPADLIGKNYWTEYPEARGTPFANAYVWAMQIQQPVYLEEYYQHWDRWFENRIFPTQDGLTIFFTDITTRRQAAEDLRQSEVKFRLIAETIQEVFWIADVDLQHIEYVSPGYEQIWGRSCQSLYDDPQSFLAAIHADDRPQVLEDLKAEKEGRPFAHEYRIVRPDGSIRWIFDHGFPVHLDDGHIRHYVGSARDITEWKQMEFALRVSEQAYKTLVENTPDIIARYDRECRHIYVNPAVTGEFGLRPEMLLGRTSRELGQEPELADRAEALVRQAFDTGQEVISEMSSMTPHGVQTYLSRGVPEFAEDGSVQSVLFIHRNITGRKKAEDLLRAAEARYRDIFENAIEGIFQSTPDGRFLRVNLAMAQIYGYASPEEMITAIGNQIATRIYAHPERRDDFVRPLVQTGQVTKYEAENLRKDGSVIWTRTSARAITDEMGAIQYYEGFLEDFTESKLAQEELRKAHEMLQKRLRKIEQLQKTLQEQANHDALTGLYNRHYLYATLDRELARARRERQPVVVMMIDIDDFKQVNDTYGHQAGDKALTALSGLLRSGVRSCDIACRYGGEEFLVLMPGISALLAADRAEVFRLQFSQLPVACSSGEFWATISIGVAAYPGHGSSMDAVIKAADDALYEAKRAGKNCIRVWENR